MRNWLMRFLMVLSLLHMGVSQLSAQYLGGNGDGLSLITLTPGSCSSTSVNPFRGGSAEGHTVSTITPVSCSSISVNPYKGGSADGHSEGTITPVVCSSSATNPYKGGSSDGHSLATVTPTVCAASAVNPYKGGNADGFSAAAVVPVTCSALAVNPYKGGSADGNYTGTIIPVVCSAIAVNPYAGGSADGLSLGSIIPVVCSVNAVNPFKGGNADGYSAARIVNNSSCLVLLPVTLLKIEGTCRNNINLIEWLTTKEKDCLSYSITKSNNLINWLNLGEISCQNNYTQTSGYQFSDKTNGEDWYYQVTEIDFDGKQEKFPLVYIPGCLRIDNAITMFPNPADNTVYINLNGVKYTSLKIINMLGQVVITMPVPDSYFFQVDLAGLAEGNYVVKLEAENSSPSIIKLEKSLK